MLSSASETERPTRLPSLPERFRDKTIAGFDETASDAAKAGSDAAREFIAQPEHRSLLLVGRPGAGKSHLAAAICTGLWAREYTLYRERADDVEAKYAAGDDNALWPPSPLMARWVNVPSLINRLRGGDDDVRAEARDAARFRGLLVLDDLGREKVTEWTGETIYVLINERYEQRLSTIVTSNLSVKDLADNGYGPAISRLAEDGRLVEMSSATDYRARRGDR